MLQTIRLLSLLAIALVQLVATELTDGVSFHLLESTKLCNNGERDTASKCVVHKGGGLKADPVACDTRDINPDHCRLVAVVMETFSSEHLLQLVPTIDSDSTVRRVEVKIGTADTDLEAVGEQIDLFLTHRPWWYVTKEPNSATSRPHHVIVLDRVHHGLEAGLRVTAALQYPTSRAICAASPLLLNRRDFYHPGWYSALVVDEMVREELPYAIVGMYVSYQNGLEDNTSFVSGSDCPHTVNKWNCAFLPTTSCPVPHTIANCTERNCVQSVVGDSRWSTAIFDSASTAGKFVDEKSPDMERVRALGSKPAQVNGVLRSEIELATKVPPLGVRYVLPYSSVPFDSQMFYDGDQFISNFLIRYSAFYRDKIRSTIAQVREEQKFAPEERCVAAQVRRGDRALVGVDMRTYCQSKDANADFGCQGVPYASVTLHHILESAAKIVDPAVRTIVVSTDDEEWLEEEKIKVKETHADWKVVNVAAPKLGSSNKNANYDFMRFGAGTSSGVLLHGSIELSRQCEGFVGHFGCGGTMMFYKAMCARHNQWDNVCPPSFDVRSIKELNVHILSD